MALNRLPHVESSGVTLYPDLRTLIGIRKQGISEEIPNIHNIQGVGE